MHAFHSQILREYDIRGTVGKNLDERDALLLGRCFAQMMREQNLKTIAIGRDGRLTSPTLTKALTQGLIEGGIRIKDIGLGPTPLLYFAVKHLGTDAGIMVTGSHNPPQDNGFKMSLATRPFFGQDIQHLATLEGKAAETQGSVEQVDVLQDYIQRLLKDYRPAGKRLKVAWDPGNGAAGQVVEILTEKLSSTLDSVTINTTIDGTFPAHHPDPTVPKNLEQLINLVRENHCDLGIAFDGDADRIGVVDGQGRILWGDQLMVLWSRDVLKRHPGATIIADVKASQVLFDDITSNKGEAIMARTGHSLIKSKMKETGALLAGEMSGHVFFADEYYGYDDALYAAIRLLNILHACEESLADLFDALPKRFSTPELRIYCEDEKKFSIVDKILQDLEKKGENVNDIDGVRVSTAEGWWLLRASNTQPCLVARCEADSESNLQILQKQLTEHLQKFNLTFSL